MYLKHTLKYCLRTPLRTLLFVILISLTTSLLIIQFTIYKKGNSELERTREAYKVIGDISIKKDNDDNSYNLFSYSLAEDIINTLSLSPYIEKVDLRFNNFGNIDGVKRLPMGLVDTVNDIFFKGHVLNGVEKEDTIRNYWELEVSIDEILFAREDPGDIIKLHINADDRNFDYNRLLKGETFFFTNASKIDYLSNSSYYQIGVSPLDRGIFSKEEAEASPEIYDFALKHIKNLEAMNNTFQFTHTNDLISIPDFFHGIANISEGRTFTKDEYDNGSRVCIISQELADQEEVKIGDTYSIKMTNDVAYYVFPNYIGINTEFYNANFLEEDTYKVIGVYDTRNVNMEDKHYFSNNSIFVPLKSCPDIISPEKTYKTYFTFNTSFTLSSPDKKYELLENLEERQFDFDNYNVNIYDQGYELIRMILKNMIDSSLSLLLISFITIILVFGLLVYIYLAKRQKEFVIMRIMGERKNRASITLYLGILLIAILGTLVGGIIASTISEDQVKKAYEVGQKEAQEEGIEGGVYSDTYVFDSDIPSSYIFIPVAVIYGVLLLLCFIGYIKLSNRSLIQFTNERLET